MKTSKKVKITKNSTYYRWIESVGANVKVYPCQHEKADYKSVQALADKQHEEIKKLNQDKADLQDDWNMCDSVCDKKEFEIRALKKDKEDLQVKLGESIEQLILNNKSWEQKYERMAKLFIGYKRKYISLFGLKEAADSMGIDTDNPSEEEVKAAKDYTFKQKETKLESGRIKSEFFLTKKRTKH